MGVDWTIDITAEQRRTILTLLKRYLPNTTAWVYGSRVAWTSRPASDLDMVVFATPEQDHQVANLREAFEESNLPFRVDLFVWDDVPPGFRKQIDTEHVTLVESDERQNPTAWPETVLGDLIDIKHGFAFKGNFIHDVPQNDILLTPGNFSIGGGFKGEKFKYYSGFVPKEFVLNGGDVIVSMTDLSKQSDTLGYPAVVPVRHDARRYLHNQRLGKVLLKAPAEVDIKYVYYVMCSSGYRNEVLASATGTTVKHTSPERIKRFSFLLAPLSEQRVIARILGALDEKIALNQRMNETLETMAQTLFKSWFIDFDPVRAKMEGLHPGVSHPIANLFPDRLVESDTWEMPKGWKLAPLPEIVELNPKRSLEKGEPAPYLDMANMPTKGHRPDKIVRRPFGSGMRFTNGDTLIARITPCLENGKTAYIDFLEDSETGWGSTEYIVMRPRPPLPNEFAYCLARSDTFREFAIQNMTGTSGRQRVPAAALSQFLFPSPPKQVARGFARLVQPLIARASEAVRESSSLAALRDTLLPMLISGKLHLTARTDEHSLGH